MKIRVVNDAPQAPRPKCRCAERREAMARAMECRRNGDTAGWDREVEFITRTTREDAAALATWMRGNRTFNMRVVREEQEQ